jgi:hypothetical protein
MRLCITMYVYCWSYIRLSGYISAYRSDSNTEFYKRCLGRTYIYQYRWRHIAYYGSENLKGYALFIVGFLSCPSATDADSLWTPTRFDIRAALVGFVLDKVTKYYPNILLRSVFIVPPKIYFCNHSISTDAVIWANCRNIVTTVLCLCISVSYSSGFGSIQQPCHTNTLQE